MLRFTLVVIAIFCGSLSAICQGENLFDDAFLHEIQFSSMDTTLIDGSKVYQMVDMTIDGQEIDSVGIKEKGNISNGVPNLKVPFKIKTNKYISGRKYDGIKEFTLHNSYQDPTMMREKLTYDLCGQLGLHALRTAFAKVYINGKYWGLYTIVEGKDEMFKQRFDHRDADAIESLDFGTMCFISDNPDDYNFEVTEWPYYQLENGDETTAFARFAEMINVANNTPDADYVDKVSKYLNLDHFFRYQAANVYLMNFDSYIGFNGNQIYMYDTTSFIWQVVPWDFNASLNLWDDGNDLQHADTYPLLPVRITNGCIADRLNTVGSLKDIYLNAMCSFVNKLADTITINNTIDFYKNQIKSAVYQDWRKVYSNDEFDWTIEYGNFFDGSNEFEGLKTFFVDRYEVIKQSLEDEGFNCSTTSVNDSASVDGVEFFPNPSNGSLYLKSDAYVNKVSVYDITGKLCFVIDKPEFPLNVEALQSGLYVFSVMHDQNQVSNTKIVIR